MTSVKKKYIFEKSVSISSDIEDIFNFHLDTNNLPKISPSFPKASLIKISEIPLQKGSEVTVGLDFILFKKEWEILIKELIPNKLIGDLQLKGVFEYWYHSHIFENKGEQVTMTDKVEFIPPFGKFGKLLIPFIRLQLSIMFNYRHKKTKLFFES